MARVFTDLFECFGPILGILHSQMVSGFDVLRDLSDNYLRILHYVSTFASNQSALSSLFFHKPVKQYGIFLLRAGVRYNCYA